MAAWGWFVWGWAAGLLTAVGVVGLVLCLTRVALSTVEVESWRE